MAAGGRAKINVVFIKLELEACRLLQLALQGMRCVQQISLLKLWERLRGKHELPQFEALNPEEISPLTDKLSLSEVVRVDKQYCFRIIQNGAQFDRMYPERRVGKFLDEVLPPAFRDQALLLHKQVVVCRQPSFSFSMLRKADDMNGCCSPSPAMARMSNGSSPLSRSSASKMDLIATTY